MKRSKVNEEIIFAKQLLEKYQITLPQSAYWDYDKFVENKDKLAIIRQIRLGWDVTDYGINEYEKVGGVLYTVRNGKLDKVLAGVPYAEKYIILRECQALPTHFHHSKTEDIINRAGGILALKLYNALENNDIDYESQVDVDIDGITHSYAPGEVVEVPVGSSITLRPRLYHSFWALEGHGSLIVGEVSSLNDDETDNYFNPPLARYSSIEEDESPICPLCNEYEGLYK